MKARIGVGGLGEGEGCVGGWRGLRCEKWWTVGRLDGWRDAASLTRY